MVSSSWLAALCKRLLCLKVIARYLGSGCGLKLGRQAAWRPGRIGMVSSSLLAALCRQSAVFKSDCGRYLGSGCGLKLGRQAAWRPGTIGMVSSSWLAAPCKQLLCLQAIAETWALAAGSNSVVKLLGGRVSIWMVSSSWLAALCKQLLCLKVIARYLGSGYGFRLGRQAAWRPGCAIGMVLSERHQQ